MAFRQSRKSSLGLHPPVGKTSPHVLSDFAFHAFRLFTSFAGMGISRSLYAFGVHPRSGLWLTRTVFDAMFRSVQYVCITSCSRIPVMRKNSNHRRSSASHALKNLFSSSRSYTSGSSSTNRGQSFLPTNPRIPCAFRNVITFSNWLYMLRGACAFSSRTNAANFSMSLRSMSVRFNLWQDSTKYASAVRYAANVLGFLLSLVSSRYPATDA